MDDIEINYNTFICAAKVMICLKTGNGGNAGRQTIYITRLLGNIELKTCRGTGGQAAKNGVGGEGDVSHLFCIFKAPLHIHKWHIEILHSLIAL